VTKAAELSTYHFIRAGFERFEPHRNERTGNCVRGNAHVRQIEIMDHIFGRQLDNYRPIDRYVQLSEHNQIVFAGGIVRIEAQ
jgi:hypothetical protein